MKPTNESERRAAPATVRLQVGTLGALILAVFAILAVVAIVGSNGLKENRRGTRCVIDQLVEHRASSLVHEYQSAAAEGEGFIQPRGINAPSADAIDAAVDDIAKNCKGFLPGNLEQLEPPPPAPASTTTTTGPGSTLLPAPAITSAPGLTTRTTARRTTTTRRRSTPTTRRSSTSSPTTRPTPPGSSPPTSPPCTLPFPQLCGAAQ